MIGLAQTPSHLMGTYRHPLPDYRENSDVQHFITGLTSEILHLNMGKHEHPKFFTEHKRKPIRLRLDSHRHSLHYQLGQTNSRAYLGASRGNIERTQIINGLPQAPFNIIAPVARIDNLHLTYGSNTWPLLQPCAKTNSPPCQNGLKWMANRLRSIHTKADRAYIITVQMALPRYPGHKVHRNPNQLSLKTIYKQPSDGKKNLQSVSFPTNHYPGKLEATILTRK